MHENTHEAAAAWLVRMRDEGVTPEDCAEFVTWLEHSPDNETAYREVAGAVDNVAHIRLAASTSRPKPTRVLVPVLAAAVVAFGLLSPMAIRELTTERMRTAIGETRAVELADGSDVVLNTASRIDVRYSVDQRRLELRAGEAFFDVAPIAERPFVVAALGYTIRATGTQFAVRVQDDRVLVLVLEGAVLVEGPGHDAETLTAGQKAVAGEAETNVATVDERDLTRAMSWRSGWLMFSGETLEEATREVARYNDVAFEFGSDQARAQLVYAHIRTTDLETFLSGIASNPSLAVTRVSAQRVQIDSR